MTHRHKNAEIPKATTWEAMHNLLFGLGREPLSLDGQRITLPRAYVQALRPVLAEPWVVTYHPVGRLDLMTRAMWAPYSEHQRDQLCEAISPKIFELFIAGEVSFAPIDARCRVTLKQRLIGFLGGTGDANSLILSPGYAWLELWPESAMRELLNSAASEAAKAFQAALSQVVPELAHSFPNVPLENDEGSVSSNGSTSTRL